MADSDSDSAGNLLKDIDDLDDELFDRKKENKPAQPRRAITNIDEILGNPTKEKRTKRNLDDFFSSSPLKKPTVSFLDQLDESVTQTRDDTTSTSKKIPHDALNRRSTEGHRGKNTRAEAIDGTRERKAEVIFDGHSRSPEIVKEKVVLKSPQYDRTLRLENEIDRLNREIDALRRKQSEDEEKLIGEWKDKLRKKEQQYEEEFKDVEDKHRKQLDRLKSEQDELLDTLRGTFQHQLEAISEGRKKTKSYEDMIMKVDDLASRMADLSTTLDNMSDKSREERKTFYIAKEQQLAIREERLKKEEERIYEEKQAVTELNMKLKILYEQNEHILLKEKWQLQEDRKKLVAEKESFKEEQKKILEAVEGQRIDLELSRKNFLREQHDLLIRVMSAQSAVESEKSTLDMMKNRDIKRLKMEAAQLEEKLKEVRKAEQVLYNSQRIYEQKYQKVVELEQMLIDECFELERCRQQMQNAHLNETKQPQQKSSRPYEMRVTSAPDFIADPYINEGTTPRREKIQVKADGDTEMSYENLKEGVAPTRLDSVISNVCIEP